MKESQNKRADRIGPQRRAFDRAKKKIYATQNLCGICGKPVDFSLKYPNPMAASVDHIIPLDRGGHPSDMDNLQLAHWTCNRQKSDKLLRVQTDTKSKEYQSQDICSNRNLPQSCNWAAKAFK